MEDYYTIKGSKDPLTDKRHHNVESIKKTRRLIALTETDIHIYNRMKSLLETFLRPVALNAEIQGHEFTIIMGYYPGKTKEVRQLIAKEKRETDILLQLAGIDDDETLLFLICQDTDLEGATHFSNRLINAIRLKLNPYQNEADFRVVLYKITGCNRTERFILEVLNDYKRFKLHPDHWQWIRVKKMELHT